MAKNQKVVCETPTPGKKPTRIDQWKYDTIKNAILNVIPENARELEFRNLSQLVRAKLTDDEI